MSLFTNTSEGLVFLGEETRTSRAGNPFTLVTIGDSKEYQTHTFFKDDLCNTAGIAKHDEVDIALKLDTVGYDQRISLLSIKKAAK